MFDILSVKNSINVGYTTKKEFEIMFCPTCGEPLVNGTRICSKCGEDVSIGIKNSASDVMYYNTPSKKSKKMKKRIILISSFAVLAVGVAVALPTVILPGARYYYALNLIDEGKYLKAKNILSQIKNFSDAEEYYNSIYLDENDMFQDCDFVFDSSRNLVSCFQKSEFIYKMTYDSKGKCTKTVIADSEDDIEKGDFSTIDYSYDINGNVNVVVYTNPSKKAETIEYEYNNRGYCTAEKTTDSDGSVSKRDYTYDINGNCIQNVLTYSDGTVDSVVYTYDNNNNCTTEKYSYATGYSVSYQYKYDFDGRCIEMVNTDSDKEVRKYESKYDKNGNCIYRRYTSPDGKVHDSTFTYNEDANKVIVKDEDGQHTIEYVFLGKSDNFLKSYFD